MAVMTMFKQDLNHLLVNRVIQWFKCVEGHQRVNFYFSMLFQFCYNILFGKLKSPHSSCWGFKTVCYLWSHFLCLLLQSSPVHCFGLASVFFVFFLGISMFYPGNFQCFILAISMLPKSDLVIFGHTFSICFFCRAVAVLGSMFWREMWWDLKGDKKPM